MNTHIHLLSAAVQREAKPLCVAVVAPAVGLFFSTISMMFSLDWLDGRKTKSQLAIFIQAEGIIKDSDLNVAAIFLIILIALSFRV